MTTDDTRVKSRRLQEVATSNTRIGPDASQPTHEPRGTSSFPVTHLQVEERLGSLVHNTRSGAEPPSDQPARIATVADPRRPRIGETGRPTSAPSLARPALPQQKAHTIAWRSKRHAKRPSLDVLQEEDGHGASKRQRLNPPGILDFGSLKSSAESVVPGGVTSPLFFSNTSRSWSELPTAAFATPDSTVTMLKKFAGDQDRVTTVRLPQGYVNLASPASANSTSSSGELRGSLHGISTSPENRPLPPYMPQLQSIGMVDLLEQDDRPTFLLDIANAANSEQSSLKPIYQNAALKSLPRILDLLSQDADNNAEFLGFKAWAYGPIRDSPNAAASIPFYTYGGISWRASTIKQRFRLIRGDSMASVNATPAAPVPKETPDTVMADSNGPLAPKVVDDGDYFGDAGSVVGPAEQPFLESAEYVEMYAQTLDPSIYADRTELQSKLTFDWTRISITPSTPEHIKIARSTDWGSTILGPIEEWDGDLRVVSNMIMASPNPSALWWCREGVAIYNEAYVEIAGAKHPGLLGMRYDVAWTEIWDEIKPIWDACWDLGQATMKNDDRLFISRNGYLEECFFNWSLTPVIGGDGKVKALYNPAFENTKRKVNERRMLTLREVGEKVALARDVKGFWQQVLRGLEYNEFDVPFALIYSVAEDSEAESMSMHSGSIFTPPQVTLEGALGVPEGHPLCDPTIDLVSSNEGFASHMRASLSQHGNPVVLSKEAGTLPDKLIEGLEWRGFGDPCRTIVVFPVLPTTGGDAVVGFIVMGSNPRRPYDEDDRLFTQLVSRQLATSMASVVLFEEEIKRGQRAARLAAMDRQELSKQLQIRTQEAVESEYKFTRMAEFAPVGIFIADATGAFSFCNEAWWEISRHRRSAQTVNTWMDSILPADKDKVETAWKRLVDEKIPITLELRFKSSREANGHPIETWALMSASHEKDDDGFVQTIFGCITDISQQKWAEAFQNQRRVEAVELKRQQENFIDITSHEMRNPLSAIIQCADEITGSVSTYKTDNPEAYAIAKPDGLLEGCLEAATTIALCASHQKRIIDDVLTLSKLDSQLLLVTPVDSQPVQVVQTVLKMFDAELNSHNIRGEFRIEDSYANMGVDWAKLDPSRMRQVLINLMTNAIKFTQNREERRITITLGSARTLADAKLDGVQYFSDNEALTEDITANAEWGDGEPFYLHLAVTDTGPGLNASEQALLGRKFAQASPRTHVQYGGSGIGLWLSKTLTELQGGQIGVKSEKGAGSTFAFYIRSRRVDVPAPSALLHKAAARSFSPPKQSPTVLPATSTINALANGKDASASKPAVKVPPNPSKASKENGAAPLDILIVEDNIVNQTVLERQLRKAGNTTHVANHGGEALQAIQRSGFWNHAHPAAATFVAPGSRPRSSSVSSTTSGTSASGAPTTTTAADKGEVKISVILMDLEMPVMDGMTCARQIRQLEKQGVINAHIPIIAVTAYARPEQIASTKDAGMDDVISKPFRMPELIAKVQELLAKHTKLEDVET